MRLPDSITQCERRSDNARPGAPEAPVPALAWWLLSLGIAVALFEPLDARLARETYLDALSAALFAGRLPHQRRREAGKTVRAAAPPPPRPARAPDLLLDGLASPDAAGLQGYAGQRGAISEQLVLDLEIVGGGVCRAGLLVIEIAARNPGVRIRADGQPSLGHRGK
jgi:hypothetical protein